MVIKKFNQSESTQKIMQVCVDVTCMYNNFGGHGLSGFRDLAHFSFAFKTAKISFTTMDYKSMRVKKWNWLKKFMQVEIDMKCMQTNFDGRGLSGFGDLAHFSFAFKTAKISLSDHGL